MMMSLVVASLLAGPMTAAEVARHDRAEDCWLILDGQVYDVTSFLSAHPGQDAILRGCGKDATYLFTHRDEKGGHSGAAQQLLPSFHLGALGDELPEGWEAPPPPPSPRLAGTSLGNQPTADVGPAKSLTLRIGHHISTKADVPSGIAMQAGYSTGRFDILVSDEQSVGVGSLQVKGQLLAQGAAAPRPLSLAVVAGAGMGYKAGAPALYGQLIAQRTLVGDRMALRANATASLSPGVDDSARASAGVAFEFRPIPLHGVFASVQAPFEDPAQLTWNAGLSFYTRQHAFALYAASTPSLHPVALSGIAPRALSIGLTLERAFLLGR